MRKRRTPAAAGGLTLFGLRSNLSRLAAAVQVPRRLKESAVETGQAAAAASSDPFSPPADVPVITSMDSLVSVSFKNRAYQLSGAS